MNTIDIRQDFPTEQILPAAEFSIDLAQTPKRFYRHGWQSWSLTTWVDPKEPMVPISAHQTRAKDEDPPYALSNHPVSAWVGAAEMDDGKIVLTGALEMSGRVEILGNQIHAFYEDGHPGKWFISRGNEGEVFKAYAKELGRIYGQAKPHPPRVWCSWYSLYNSINQAVIEDALDRLGDLPFNVIQLDDGWQVSLGEWEPNSKFPAGMKDLADKIRKTGRAAGLWLSPLVTARNSHFAREHPDWLLRDRNGQAVYAGIGWSGELVALDCSRSDVLQWLDQTIRKVVGWGYTYLKLDFLYAGAVPGQRNQDIPRETSYRKALQVIREAAGRDTYLLACGAPILPVLGICDGIRVGPDVAPFWLSTPLSIWLNNPNNPGTRNGIRTSLNRMWLKDLIQIDPDVVYFRTRHNRMTPEQNRLLQDLVRLTGFIATSDLPQWLEPGEREALRQLLLEQPEITRISRYEYKIGDHTTDFSPVMPLPSPVRFPAQPALLAGILESGIHELLPGLIESWRARLKKAIKSNQPTA